MINNLEDTKEEPSLPIIFSAMTELAHVLGTTDICILLSAMTSLDCLKFSYCTNSEMLESIEKYTAKLELDKAREKQNETLENNEFDVETTIDKVKSALDELIKNTNAQSSVDSFLEELFGNKTNNDLD